MLIRTNSPRCRSGRRLVVLSATCVSVLVPFNTAKAATWDGLSGVDGNWTTPENWNPDGAPVAGDVLNFPATAGTRVTNNDFAAGTQFNGITIPGNAYTLAGNMINLGGAFAFTAGGTNQGTVNLDVTLLQDTDIDVAATSGSGRLNWNGAIAGNFDLNKTGAGMLRIGGSARAYTGDTNVNAGVLSLVGDALPSGAGKGNVNLASAAEIRSENVSFQTNGLSGAGSIFKNGSNTRGITLGNGDANGAFTGGITWGGGSSGITKVGTGTQSLGNITAAGGVSANAGTLRLNGTVTAASVTASTGATVGGAGALTLSGALTANGTVAPGDGGAGTLDVNAASYSLSATGGLSIELGGLTPGDGAGNYDQLNLTNAVAALTIDPAATLTVSMLSGFAGGAGDAAYILTRADGAAFSTLFAGTTEGGLVNLGSGATAQITYLANWTGTQVGSSLTGGNDVALFNFQGVPEPASVALIGLGALALLARRR